MNKKRVTVGQVRSRGGAQVGLPGPLAPFFQIQIPVAPLTRADGFLSSELNTGQL